MLCGGDRQNSLAKIDKIVLIGDVQDKAGTDKLYDNPDIKHGAACRELR